MVFSLPCKIGKNVSVKDFNAFLDCNESTGYKFYWNKHDKNVYIVEMASTEHEAVVEIVGDAFRELCPRATYGLWQSN